MRVLFVSHSSHLYGGQRSLLDLVVGLKGRGVIEPMVVTPPGPLVGLLRQAGIAVLEQRVPWWIERGDDATSGRVGRAWRSLRTGVAGRRAAAAIAAAVRDWRPAIVHTNVIATDVGHRVARRLGVPHVWHVREFVKEDLGYRFIAGRRSSLARVRESALVVFNSKAVQQRFADELGRIPSHVVYNGFHFRSEPPPRRTTRGSEAVLLIVGHLRPGKGHVDALQALAELRRRHLPVRLRIAGLGRPDWETTLRATCNDLGVAADVDFLGQVTNMAAEYAAADVVVACSAHEPFGRVVIEAFDHGVPVVAADAAGFRETVIEGTTGRLYPPGQPIRLADCIEGMLRDPEAAQRMATRGRAEAIEHFSIDAYIQTMERLLLDLVA